jgi:broad specificity phosphatase PhoE
METENPGKLVALFVRHGETEGNAKGLFRGALDFPLSDKGHKDASRLADYFSNTNLGTAYSSDTARARTTAETVLEPKGITASETPDLRSWNVGYLAGLPKSEHQKDIDFFQHNSNTVVPNGESLNQFRNRVQPRIKHSILTGIKDGVPSITFTHSSVVQEVSHMLHNDYKFAKVKPGGVIGVYQNGNKLSVKALFKPSTRGTKKLEQGM